MIPFLHEGKEMHAGVAEIDVHEIDGTALEYFQEDLQFSTVIDGRAAADVFEVKALDEILPSARDELDVLERKAVGVLALAGEDNGIVTAEADDLPVDVQHLGLQKRGAVAGYDRLHGKLSGSFNCFFWCFTFTGSDQFSEIGFQGFDALAFSGGDGDDLAGAEAGFEKTKILGGFRQVHFIRNDHPWAAGQ